MTNHVYQMQGNLSSQQERRRIGFISSFFRKHSVGKLIKGIITELCKQTTYRNKYEVTMKRKFVCKQNGSESQVSDVVLCS